MLRGLEKLVKKTLVAGTALAALLATSKSLEAQRTFSIYTGKGSSAYEAFFSPTSINSDLPVKFHDSDIYGFRFSQEVWKFLGFNFDLYVSNAISDTVKYSFVKDLPKECGPISIPRICVNPEDAVPYLTTFNLNILPIISFDLLDDEKLTFYSGAGLFLRASSLSILNQGFSSFGAGISFSAGIRAKFREGDNTGVFLEYGSDRAALRLEGHKIYGIPLTDKSGTFSRFLMGLRFSL